jgi:hypothetical protein
MLKKKIGNLSDRMRHGTLFEAFQYRLSRIGIVVAPYYWVQEGLDLERLQGSYDALEGFSFGPFGSDEIKVIAASKSWNYTEEELLSWLSSGKRCVGAKCQGEIAAFMWIECDECNCQYFTFKLQQNEAYLFDMFTMKPFRGKGLAPFLRCQSYRILKDIGRDTIYSYTDYFNVPSINFKKKLNAKVLKVGLYVEFFKKYRWNIFLKSKGSLSKP